MPAKSIAQLPPPPPPPVFQQTPKKEMMPIDGQQQQQKLQRPATADGAGTLERVRKRSPITEMAGNDQPIPAAKKFIASNKSAVNSRVATPDNKNSTSVPPQQHPITGDQIKIPQIKQEEADFSPASISPDKKPSDDSNAMQKKKIGLSEYKQRLKHIKPEPADSPASQSTPTSMHSTTPNMMSIKMEDDGSGNYSAIQRSTTPSPMVQTDGEQKAKRQSFMPDLANASSIDAEALTLPIGIPMVEEKKKKEKDQQPGSLQHQQQSLEQFKEQQVSKESSSRSAGHNVYSGVTTINTTNRSQHKEQRSHQHGQLHHNREKGDKHHRHRSSSSNHRFREGNSSNTKIYLNGVSSNSTSSTMEQQQRQQRHQQEREQQRQQIYQMKEVKQEKQKPPPPPHSPNGNGNVVPPPPPPPENDLEEGELV